MTTADYSDFTYLIEDRLAQGAAPPVGARLPFDVVVLAAMEYQPILPDYEVLRASLDDGPPPTPAERALVQLTAGRVARRVRAGGRVLVTCWQGRNRSGVVAGLALVELGLPGPEAAAMIRRLRGGLTNPHFFGMVASASPPRWGVGRRRLAVGGAR